MVTDTELRDIILVVGIDDTGVDSVVTGGSSGQVSDVCGRTGRSSSPLK